MQVAPGSAQALALAAKLASTKVVDEAGQPLVVYHGTPHQFTEFSLTDDGGFHFGDEAAAGWRLAHLTGDEGAPGNRVIPAFLAISNPLVLEFDAGTPERWAKVISAARAAGFDGISYPNEEEADEDLDTGEPIASTSWVAFSPDQIVNAPGVDRALLAEALVQLHADRDAPSEVPRRHPTHARLVPHRFDPTENPMNTALLSAAPPANPTSAPFSPMAIEYVTRDLFKGKSLRAAANTFFRKFNGVDNLFLGRMNHSVEEIMQAVLRDKAILAIEGAAKMRPGNAEIAILGTARQFGLEEAVLSREIAKIVAQSAGLELIETREPIKLAVDLLNAAHPFMRAAQEQVPEEAEEDAAPAPRA